MTPEILLREFERLSDAPDAVGRLRQLVLDLAVRGKLVEQDAADEQASELLKRVCLERSRLAKRGEIPHRNIDSDVVGLERIFEPPAGWVWTRLGVMTIINQGFAFPSSDYSEIPNDGPPLIKIGDIGSDAPNTFIKGDFKTSYLVRPGELLLGLSGSIKCAIWRGPAALLNQRIARINPASVDVENAWMFLCVNNCISKWKEETSKLTVQNIKAKQLHEAPVLLPPLAEQKRIVAKVDELMALCDRLEAARTAREATRDRLVAAALHRLTSPQDPSPQPPGQPATPPETFQTHARFYLNNLPRLATRAEHVEALRRGILDLAMCGKLVEQDPAEEPASELLKRIAAEKARLIKAGKIKKLAVDPINKGEAPFDIPVQWHWTRLGSVGDWGAGSTPSRTRSDFYEGNITWLKSGELNDNQCLSGSEEKLTEHAVTKGSFRVNQPGDVLIAMYGATIGKLAILAESAVTNQAVCGCTPFDGVLNRFLYIFLRSEREKFHASSEGGAQPNISKVKIVWTPFPLPPLAEQKRIVAKVDELMALCDDLETAIRTQSETSQRLLDAAIREALADHQPALEVA